MKIGVITSIKAPYRTLQFEEICKKQYIDMTIYYTKKDKEDRDWELKGSDAFKEVYLSNIKLFDRFGTLNTGLKDIVRNNDIIILGGYEKPTYILISLLCRIYKKKYIIIFDGISCNRLYEKENKFKWLIKNLVIKHSSAIWGNGIVSKRYFNEVFNYPLEKIYNQYLTIDGEKIKQIGKEKGNIRKVLREKYGIKNDEKVLHYSGRLVEVKNVKAVIEALNIIGDKNITLFITGDGIQRKELEQLADTLNIKIIITGFINNQEELFKHYYLSDVFILPSIYEPWGLVVNEAMFAGLPVLVSYICGSSLDLVNSNGYTIDTNDIDDIAIKINKIFNDNMTEMSNKSLDIIKKWTFKNSAESYNNLIKSLLIK